MRFFSIIFFLGSNCSEYDQIKQKPIVTEFPNILLDPEEIDFGPVPQGNTGSKTLRIGNDGDANLVIDDIYISRQGPFSVTVPSPVTELPPTNPRHKGKQPKLLLRPINQGNRNHLYLYMVPWLILLS